MIGFLLLLSLFYNLHCVLIYMYIYIKNLKVYKKMGETKKYAFIKAMFHYSLRDIKFFYKVL